MALRIAPLCGRAALRSVPLQRFAGPSPNFTPVTTVTSFAPTASAQPQTGRTRLVSAERQLRCYAAQAEAEAEKTSEEKEAEAKPEAATTEAEEEAAPEKKEEVEEKPKEDVRDQKIKELTENLKYALAETENARKIAQKDVKDAREYALKSFAKDLLDVADNMERASQSVKADDEEKNSILGPLLQGIKMTHNSLDKAFAANGIDKIEVEVGTEFDPEFHEALMQMPWSEGKEPGTIGAVFKTGYVYRNRVLRATQCGVIAEKPEE